MSGPIPSGLPAAGHEMAKEALIVIGVTAVLPIAVFVGTLLALYGPAAFACHPHATQPAPHHRQTASSGDDLVQNEASWARAVNGNAMDPMATPLD